jgi:hypothetical protein
MAYDIPPRDDMFKNVLFIEKNLVYKNTNIKIKCVNINNLIVIIKSPKQRLETYCFMTFD